VHFLNADAIKTIILSPTKKKKKKKKMAASLVNL
jgi:hypothetical protein